MKLETLRVILKPAFHFFRRVSYSGCENLPIGEPLLFISNHQGLADPFLIGFKFPDMIHWMAKKELFKNRIIRNFITSLGAFPVDRSTTGIGATKSTISLLKDGKCVGIFPQGTRAKKGKPVPKAKPGFLRLAKESGVRILPVHIYGNNHIFGKMYVHYGKPFSVPEDLETSSFASYAQEKLDEIYQMTGGTGENN